MGKKVFETVFAIGTKLNPSFSKGMLSASKRMGAVSKQATELGRQTKAIKRFKELDSAVDKAGAEFTDAASDLKRLRAEAKASPRVTAKMRSEIVKAEKAVTRTKTALDKKTASLKKTGRALEAVGVDVRKLTREEARLAVQTAKLERRQKSLAKIAGLNLGQRFNKIGSSARTLGRDFARLGALGGGLAVALGALVKRTADQGDSAAKLGANIGITAEAVQELRFAAERSGVSIAQMDKALLTLNQRMGEAAAGETEAIKGFDELGIAVDELRGKSPDDVLELVADRMAALPSVAARASAANRLLGRAGKELVGVLGEGSEALEQLRKDARATGNVMSNEAAESAEETTDALLDTKSAISGVANILGVELLPVATRVLTRFTGFVVDNREQIGVWARDFARGLDNNIPKIIKAAQEFGAFVGKIIDGAKWVADLVGGWENLAAVMVGLRLAPITLAVVGLASGIGQLAFTTGAWVVAATPAVALALSIAAAVASVTAAVVIAIKAYKEWTELTSAQDEQQEQRAHIDQKALQIAKRNARDTQALVGVSGPKTQEDLDAIVVAYRKASRAASIAGADLPQFSAALAASISQGRPEAIAEVSRLVSDIDDYLPHSDAKRGPLSRLEESGRSMAETFGKGVGQGAGGGAGATLAGAAAGGGGGAAGGMALTINAPITVQGGASGAADGIARAGQDLNMKIERTVRAMFAEQQRLSYGNG